MHALASDPEDRGLPLGQAVGRLAQGTTLAQVRQECDAIRGRLADQYRSANAGLQLGVFRLRKVLLGTYDDALLMLLGSAALLFVLASLNVTGLFALRNLSRRGEFALRVALGASRPALVWQLAVEALPLTVLGGLGGIGITWALVEVAAKVPFSDISHFEQAAARPELALTACLLSILATVVPAGLSAIDAGRADGATLLRTGEVGALRSSSRRPAELLVFLEIWTATLLFLLAVLCAASFVRLATIEWGFSPDNVLVLTVQSTGVLAEDGAAQEEAAERTATAIQRIAGVASVGWSSGVPGSRWWRSLPTRLAVGGKLVTVGWAAEGWVVSQGFFRVLGVSAVRGRVFGPRDRPGSRTIVISRALAQKLWPSQEAVGRFIEILRPSAALRDWVRSHGPRITSQAAADARSWEPDGPPWIVIGVVNDVRMHGPRAPVSPALFIDWAQQDPAPATGVLHFVVRTSTDPVLVLRQARREVVVADKHYRLVQARLLPDILARSTGVRGTPTLLLIVLASCAVVSLVVACAGVLGMVAQVVRQRLRELALRMVCGASRERIIVLIMMRVMTVTCIGVLCGVGSALAAGAWVSSVLYGTSAVEWPLLAMAAGLLESVALLAGVLPVVAALRATPGELLRSV